jgi:multiple antibiotic resistance protein
LIATAILIAFVVLGQILLEALGISLPSFSIAGGVVLLVISLRAIFEGVHDELAQEEKKAASGGVRDLAAFSSGYASDRRSWGHTGRRAAHG